MTPTSYFSRRELRCRCWRPSCDAKPVDPSSLSLLNQLRHEWGRPLVLSSATRCKEHNEKVGGAPASQHLEGRAFDIKCHDANMVQALAALAEKLGFRGVGIGRAFLHVDTRPGPEARWEYP